MRPQLFATFRFSKTGFNSIGLNKTLNSRAIRLINKFGLAKIGVFVKKHIFALIVFLVLLSSLTVLVDASQTISIPPQTKQVVSVSLSQGDSVNGTISVSGGSGGGIDFMVSDPNGKKLLSYNYTTYTSFSFSASINGSHLFSFDNSFCSCTTGKNVTIDCSVNNKLVQGSFQHTSNGGVPVFVALILVIVTLAVAAVVILTRRARTSTNNATVSP